jgi:hypothetical protein
MFALYLRHISVDEFSQVSRSRHASILHIRSYTSVAGEGVVGPCGPRTGNSSGVRPGNSSGLGGVPGSCIGGGTSGRGLPGGLSCGGSDGCPGLIGGSSRGSIGICIYIATLRLSPISEREPVTSALPMAMFRSIAAGAITAPLE